MTVNVWQSGVLTVKTRQAEETEKVTYRAEDSELGDTLKRLAKECLLHEVTRLEGAKSQRSSV